MDRSILVSFFDELEKIATVYEDPELLAILKEAGLLSTLGAGVAKKMHALPHSGPAKLMRRVTRGLPSRTGVSSGEAFKAGRGGAKKVSGKAKTQMPSKEKAKSAIRSSPAGSSAPGYLSPKKTQQSFARSNQEVAKATEKLPGMADAELKSKAVGQMAAGRRQQLDSFLKRTGRSSAPGTSEKQLSSIGGHPREITRTPARVVKRGTSAGTQAAGPAAKQSRLSSARTAVTPTRRGVAYEPTVVA